MTDDDTIEFDYEKIKNFFMRIPDKAGFIIMFLMLVALLSLYMAYRKDIASCNAYYQGIIAQMKSNISGVIWSVR